MRIVTMLPKSKRGKQLVKQHGNRWEVVRVLGKVLFSDKAGPWMLVTPVTEPRIHESVRDTREDTASRWVHAFFDDNFTVAP